MGFPEDVDALHALTAELESKLHTQQATAQQQQQPLPVPAEQVAYTQQPVAEPQPSAIAGAAQQAVQFLPYEAQAAANQVLYWMSMGWKSAVIAIAVAVAAAAYSGQLKLPSFLSACASVQPVAPLQPVAPAPLAAPSN